MLLHNHSLNFPLIILVLIVTTLIDINKGGFLDSYDSQISLSEMNVTLKYGSFYAFFCFWFVVNGKSVRDKFLKNKYVLLSEN